MGRKGASQDRPNLDHARLSPRWKIVWFDPVELKSFNLDRQSVMTSVRHGRYCTSRYFGGGGGGRAPKGADTYLQRGQKPEWAEITFKWIEI